MVSRTRRIRNHQEITKTLSKTKTSDRHSVQNVSEASVSTRGDKGQLVKLELETFFIRRHAKPKNTNGQKASFWPFLEQTTVLLRIARNLRWTKKGAWLSCEPKRSQRKTDLLSENMLFVNFSEGLKGMYLDISFFRNLTATQACNMPHVTCRM